MLSTTEITRHEYAPEIAVLFLIFKELTSTSCVHSRSSTPRSATETATPGDNPWNCCISLYVQQGKSHSTFCKITGINFAVSIFICNRIAPSCVVQVSIIPFPAYSDPISSQLRDDQFVSLNFSRSTSVYFPFKLVCRTSKINYAHYFSVCCRQCCAMLQHVSVSLEDSSISLHSYMPRHAPRVNRFRVYHVILQSASIKTKRYVTWNNCGIFYLVPG